nr:hypothetical protein [Tanacetum cinerariifolium]
MIPEPGDAERGVNTILLGLPEDIYAAVDSCETAQEIWLRVQQMMKGSDIGIQEKKAKLFNEWERGASSVQKDGSTHQDQSPFNQHYMQQPMPNPEDITDPTTAMNMRISSNSKNRQIAQPGMNMGQDRQMQMIGDNSGNQFRQYAGQNAGNPAGYNDVIGNQVIQNAVQNPRVQNVGNPNGLIGVQGNRNQNQIGNGNLMAVRAEGNAA